MVLGATGFIGPALVRRLHAHGCEVLAASRGLRDATPEAAATPVQVDRADPAAIVTALDKHQPDAVIDLIAYSLARRQPAC